MRTRSLHRLTAVTALALASMAAAAACTSAPEPTAASSTGTVPGSTAPTSAVPIPAASTVPVKPVHDPAPGPTSTSPKCLGMIVHRINAADTGRRGSRGASRSAECCGSKTSDLTV